MKVPTDLRIKDRTAVCSAVSSVWQVRDGSGFVSLLVAIPAENRTSNETCSCPPHHHEPLAPPPFVQTRQSEECVSQLRAPTALAPFVFT